MEWAGYPMILMPFVALKLPKISIELLNAVFHYCSIVFFYKAILLYVPHKISLITSLFWACYYIAYQEIPVVFSEPLTLFLSAIIIYCICKAFSQKQIKPILYAGIALGFLVLTKVVFGYVLFVMLFISVFLFIIYYIKKMEWRKMRKIVLILLIAVGVVTPYLIYTYSLTGRLFYFANSGGMSLYWMSTPYEGEYGDWNNENFQANCIPEWNLPCNAAFFRKNHQTDMDFIQQFEGLARDDAYKMLAIENIKNHPLKYTRNCIANMGRLWFNFPFSYFYQRDKILLRIPPNAILLGLISFALPLSIINFRRIPMEINFIGIFFLLYLCVSMLVSAYQRQFYVIVPMLLLWSVYIISKTVSFRLKIKPEKI